MTDQALTVTALYIYPVKGCEAVPVRCLTIFDQSGPDRDREFMVVGPDGKFWSQRTHPRLARIRTSYGDGQLALTAHGVLGIRVDLPDKPQRHDVRVHADSCSGLDCGDNVAKWLSSYLGDACRLVRRDRKNPRVRQLQVDTRLDEPKQSWEMSFADGYPVLLATEESRLEVEACYGRQLSMLRFRPNVVVSGGQAFDEDNWRNLVFTSGDRPIMGGHPPGNLLGVKLCSRCTVPDVNQLTGVPDDDGDSVVKTLTKMGRVLPEYPYDPKSKKGAMFGLNCLPVLGPDPTEIHVGDRVTVVSRLAKWSL